MSPPGGPNSSTAIGLAVIETLWRVLFTRTTDLGHPLEVARGELALEATIVKLDRYGSFDPG